MSLEIEGDIIMYFPYFISYIGIGITVTAIVFVWALKNRQFSDQQRARFLPLQDEHLHKTKVKSAGISHYEILGLILLAFAGLAASAAVLIFALFFS